MSTPPQTLLSVVESLNAIEAAAAKAGASGGSNSSSRTDIVTTLWTLLLQSNAKQQEDLLKQLPPPRLLFLLEEGGGGSSSSGSASAAPKDPNLGYAAVGCLAVLVGHPKWIAELTATAALVNRLVSCCVALLLGPHDRSRLPAVQLLQALAACPMQVPRLAVAMCPLLSLLAAAGGPGWAGGRQLAAAAATVLAALLAPSECEAPAQQQARRVMCLSAGAVESLLALLQGGSGGAVLLPAAACLRYLALAPCADDTMTGDPTVAAQLLRLLPSSPSLPPAVCAYVSGILWELTASPAAAQQLLEAGAVPSLLQVVRETAAAVVGRSSSSGKKGKKKGASSKGATQSSSAAKSSSSSRSSKSAKGGKAGAAAAGAGGKGGSGSSGGQAEAVQPPSFVLLHDPQAAAEVALCNATGALHHLSFLDEAKQQLGASAAHLARLVQLANSTQGQTYDNLVGLLWNVGLLDTNQPLLEAAGAPPHLVRPIPARWATMAASQLRPVSATAAAAAVSSPGKGAPPSESGCVRQTTLRFVG